MGKEISWGRMKKAKHSLDNKNWIMSVRLNNIVFPYFISGSEIKNEAGIRIKIRFSHPNTFFQLMLVDGDEQSWGGR